MASRIELANYSHSPLHYAVACQDYHALRTTLATMPRLCKPDRLCTEAAALAEENRAVALSTMIDRRDVQGGETPLHLAVRMQDITACRMLLASGADGSIENDQGWSALKEALFTRQEALATVILKYYQSLTWARHRRMVPIINGFMRGMKDFCMELTLHFESSIIPFLGRLAPPVTLKICKCASNIRVDTTFIGFEGFRLRRSEHSFLFLGEGSHDGRLSPGSICVLDHRQKQIINVLECSQSTDEQLAARVADMSWSTMYSPAIDASQAALLPQMSWRQRERTEMVGPWEAKLYDMYPVNVVVKSKRVVMAEEDLGKQDGFWDDLRELLSKDEKDQLGRSLDAIQDEKSDLCANLSNISHACTSDSCREPNPCDCLATCGACWNDCLILDGQDSKAEEAKEQIIKGSSLDADTQGNIHLRNETAAGNPVQSSSDICQADEKVQKYMADGICNSSKDINNSKIEVKGEAQTCKDTFPINHQTEEFVYEKVLQPVIWLAPSFPLSKEDLQPVLQLFANKVKGVRFLWEVLTTKLPAGTFPVKVALPVFPTIRALITVTGFQHLELTEDKTEDNHCRPIGACRENQIGVNNGSSSYFPWMKEPVGNVGVSASDLFTLPKDYSLKCRGNEA